MKIRQYNEQFVTINPAPRRTTLIDDQDIKDLLIWVKINKRELYDSVKEMDL